MDNTPSDENLSNNNSQIKYEFDDCTDDKVCVYETLINGEYIKQEPCNTEDEQGSIHNYVDIKAEVIEDPTVVVQETGLTTHTKATHLMGCDECGENYDLYCLKCSTLIRILDSNNPNSKDNRVRRTLPKNFMDIRETPSGVGIVALRVIPKGVVFGPFKGLDSTKDGGVWKWKLKNEKLSYTKDPKQLNWMQYIRTAAESVHQNLTAFQYEGELYYLSICHISVGDELLMCQNSGSEESGIYNMEDSYWRPQVCERIDDTYACTLCCVGYKSICHLEAHNSRCPDKENQKDLCKEIIQCSYYKIYIDQREYSDYHIHRCCESNLKQSVATPRSPEDTDKLELNDKCKCLMCEYSTSQNHNFRQHQLKHTDLQMYKCPECSYRAHRKYQIQKHMRTHTKCYRKLFECDHCDERFAYFDLFAMHQKKKHAASVYKCDKCMFETINARNLVRHQTMHEDVKPYHCDTGGKQCKSEKTLLKHVKNLHKEKKRKYQCPKCYFETIRPRNMKKHLMNIHSGVKRFKCLRCGFKTCYKKYLEHHLRYHEDLIPIKCKSCDIEFWSRQLFVHHRKEVHTITNQTYSCSKCEYRTHGYHSFNQHLLRVHDSKHFACILCPYKTAKNSNLKRHIAIHGDDKPFACTACPYKTAIKSALKRHLAIHGVDKLFACTLCPYKTTKNLDLKKHVAIHGSDKPFACVLCPYKTTKKSNLKQHVTIHNGEKPFKCTLCPYKTTTNSNLKRHISIHSNDKLFMCTLCPYKTTTNSNLKQHVAMHDDDKPFACTLCPYKTTIKWILKRHVAIHGGNKPFACTLCPYKTTTKSNLKRHIIIHGDDKPFACTLCPYKTTLKSALKRHVGIHNDGKPFKCDMCSQMFKLKSSLTKHARSIHSSAERMEYKVSQCEFETNY